jgi:hypothetical protein
MSGTVNQTERKNTCNIKSAHKLHITRGPNAIASPQFIYLSFIFLKKGKYNEERASGHVIKLLPPTFLLHTC